ncbi:MAG: GyrI-like domain-containing protein [Pseudorhodoplanes sp.]
MLSRRSMASAVSALTVSLIVPPAMWGAASIGIRSAGAQSSEAPPSEHHDDEFGVEITLPEKTIVYLSGNGTWDSAYETLVEALRTVYDYVEKRGLKPDGDSMMIYTGADDTGFEYKAAVPVMGPFDNPPKGDLTVGASPTGKAYKFVHRGAYDGMENLYEAITNFLDEKNIQPGDFFIERYVTDPRNTPEDELVIEVIFPVK